MEFTEIRCSEGVFKNKAELANYLGVSLSTLSRKLIAGSKSGLSEEDMIERVILCSKIKKEFNLKASPQYTDIVTFHGKYYPSLYYLEKLMGWKLWVVSDLIDDGVNLEEIDLWFKWFKQYENHPNKVFKLLKSKVGENPKFFEENGEVVIEVQGKRYKSPSDLVNDYDIPIKCLSVPSHSSFSFLGRSFRSKKEFSRFYNLSYDQARDLLNIDKAEVLVNWLYSIVDESGVTFNGDLSYLLGISRGLKYNKEDIMYQVQNYDNLKEGYTYYLGGKQYKSVTEFFESIKIMHSSVIIKRFLDEDKEKIALFKIADIINGTFTEELTYKSPKTYVVIYFYDFLRGTYAETITHFLNEIYNMLEKGLSALEIKNLLTDYMSLIKSVFKSDKKVNIFIQQKLSFLSRCRLLDYFNKEPSHWFQKVLQKFLQYSDITVIKASYRYNSLQYYLCHKNGSLCYLSGSDLLDIAVKSVKEHNSAVKEEGIACEL